MSAKSYRAKELEWEFLWDGTPYAKTLLGEFRIDIQRGTFAFRDGQGNVTESRRYKDYDACVRGCQRHYNELWQSGGIEV